MTHPVVHFEIGGRDGGKLRAFYADLFGWQSEPVGPGYWIVPPQGEGIGGGLMQTHGDVPPYVTVYVQVEDLDYTLREASELGATTLVKPTDIPGVGAFALFQDPDGNTIGLLRTSM